MKRIKYTHPSNSGFEANKVYDLDEVLKTTSIELVKILFEPIDFLFEDDKIEVVVEEIENVVKKK